MATPALIKGNVSRTFDGSVEPTGDYNVPINQTWQQIAR